jgi:hypothetical protein
LVEIEKGVCFVITYSFSSIGLKTSDFFSNGEGGLNQHSSMASHFLLLFAILHFLSACDDTPPDGKFSCQQQKSWGKCNESWMKDFCKQSCNRCNVVGPLSSSLTKNIRKTPINPKATAEARKLYSALLGQYGKKILSGQQFEKNELDYVRQHSGGKESVVVGYDFINILHFESQEKQKAYMQRAVDWSKKKRGVITFCWHWRNPFGTTQNDWATLPRSTNTQPIYSCISLFTVYENGCQQGTRTCFLCMFDFIERRLFHCLPVTGFKQRKYSAQLFPVKRYL